VKVLLYASVRNNRLRYGGTNERNAFDKNRQRVLVHPRR